MKKLFIASLVATMMLLAAVSAHAMDLAAAAALHAETGVDGICLDTPDGTVPPSLPQGWNQVTPAWVYSDSSSQAMVLSASGNTYTFYVEANQRAIAPCVSNGRNLWLYIEGSYISRTGCQGQ